MEVTGPRSYAHLWQPQNSGPRPQDCPLHGATLLPGDSSPVRDRSPRKTIKHHQDPDLPKHPGLKGKR